MSTWSVIIPIKRLAAAKTRLRGTVPAGRHEPLVLALAMDTATAALACPLVAQVVVVTDEPRARRAATSIGAVWVADEPDAGLNPALGFGAASAAGRVPAAGTAALAADLPALRPADLAAALAAAGGQDRSFVADTAGTGTVLLAARAGVALDPRFGAGSAAAHAASGAVRLDGAWQTLRRDVDTAEDLAVAVSIGLGRHTTAVLA